MGVAFSYVLMRLDLARANPVFRAASYVFAVLSVLHTLAGLCVFNNPFFSGEWVRGPVVFSSLMVAYLLPGLAALGIHAASFDQIVPTYLHPNSGPARLGAWR